MQYFTVFSSVFALFVPIIIGYIIAKTKMVDESFAKNISSLLFNITLPCSIITSMQFEFKPEMLLECGWLIAISFMIIFFGFGIGHLIAKITGAKSYFRRIMAFSTAFSNFSFMGYPVAEALFGQQGFLYAAIFSIPLFLTVQSLGVITLTTGSQSNPSDSPKQSNASVFMKSLLNPPIIAVTIGFLLFIFSVNLRIVINQSMTFLGTLTTPLAMILAGLVLVRAPLKTLFNNYRYYILILLRLVLIPLIVYWVLKHVGFDGILLGVPVVITMMPIAANLIITVTKFDGDVSAAAHLVLLSTLLSMVTIPLMSILLHFA